MHKVVLSTFKEITPPPLSPYTHTNSSTSTRSLTVYNTSSCPAMVYFGNPTHSAFKFSPKFVAMRVCHFHYSFFHCSCICAVFVLTHALCCGQQRPSQPHSEATISVIFRPTNPINYFMRVPLFIQQQLPMVSAWAPVLRNVHCCAIAWWCVFVASTFKCMFLFFYLCVRANNFWSDP